MWRNWPGNRAMMNWTAKLSNTHRGILFIVLGCMLLVYVGYQIATRQVFTKSGTTTLLRGGGFLAVEGFAAVLGIVRGRRALTSESEPWPPE